MYLSLFWTQPLWIHIVHLAMFLLEPINQSRMEKLKNLVISCVISVWYWIFRLQLWIKYLPCMFGIQSHFCTFLWSQVRDCLFWMPSSHYDYIIFRTYEIAQRLPLLWKCKCIMESSAPSNCRYKSELSVTKDKNAMTYISQWKFLLKLIRSAAFYEKKLRVLLRHQRINIDTL